MPLWRTGGVPCGTEVMSPTYARSMQSSTSLCASPVRPPSRSCQSVPRAGVVNARRPGRRPGRSEAKSIDDAEHGASIIGAMVVSFDRSPDHDPVFQANCAHARTDSCGTHRHASGRVSVRAGGAVLLHELGSQTATRDTTNDGVNDLVRVPWGQVPGTTPGSFTPSLVQ